MEEKSAGGDDAAGTTAGCDGEGADGGGPVAAAGRCSRRAQRGPLILETVSGKITQLI